MADGILEPEARVIRHWTIPLTFEWYSRVNTWFETNRNLWADNAFDGYNSLEEDFFELICKDWVHSQEGVVAPEERVRFENDVKALCEHLKLGFRYDPGPEHRLSFTFWESRNVTTRTIEDRTGKWQSRRWSLSMRDELMCPLAFIKIVVKDPRSPRKDTYYYSPKYRFELRSMAEVKYYQKKYDELYDMPNWREIIEQRGCYDQDEYAMNLVLLRRDGIVIADYNPHMH